MRKTMSAALMVVVLATSGCFNVMRHVQKDEPYKPYSSTKGMARGIVEAFVEKPEWHSGSAGEAGMAHAYALLLLPVWVIGLPLETVADTVTFPYDYFKAKK